MTANATGREFEAPRGTTTSSAPSACGAHGGFVLRRLHSLTGVAPVGVFLVVHLWTNASALAGRRSFDHAVERIQSLPALPFIELFGIFVPLLFHAVIGLRITLDGRSNAARYPYMRNWLFWLQRASGVFTVAFLCAHLWELRVQKWLFGMRVDAFYDTLEAHLSATAASVPLLALGYFLGLAAATFHLANGLAGAFATWGVAISRRAQRRLGYACAALGVALFVTGGVTLLHFATGSSILFSPPHEPVHLAPAAPCPPR